MVSKHLLGKICEISSGFQFRDRVEPIEGGTFSVIQMKDINQDYNGARLNHETMTRTVNNGFQERHFARPGDVIFCSRGNNNFSLLLQKPPENTIISGQFFVLRCSGEKLTPEYLCWFLSQAKTQRIFAGIRRGTTTQLVTTRALSEIEIPVPDIDTQKKIAEVFRLQAREKELLCTIQEKQDNFVNTLLIQKAEGKTI